MSQTYNQRAVNAPPEPAPKKPRRHFARGPCIAAWHAYHMAICGGEYPTLKWLVMNARIPKSTVHDHCVKLSLPLSQSRRRVSGARP